MTTETKFTPGPWHVGNQDIYADDIDGDDLVICAIGKASGFRSAEYSVVRRKSAADANAHLIAAAPELYEAAKRALNYIQNTESEMGAPLDSGDCLRAALAKARGEA